MRVILDVNRTSSVSWNVQVCSSVAGFIDVMKMHPEDEFVIDEASADAYVDYMRALATLDWNEFCDEMCITKQDYNAMCDYYANVEPMPDPVHDEVEFINAFCDDDYDYWLECSQDAMWITKHC